MSADSGRPDPEVQAGRALRRLRLSRNWSQEEVAGRMKAYGYDFHQTMIAKIEAAQRPLRVRELAHFAALYGVEVQQLIHPPTGSLSEIEQKIAEAEAEQARATERSLVARRRLRDITNELHESESEVAMLAQHLAGLQEAKKSLMGWGSDKDSSLAKGRTATS